jgi:hypothetical protein
MWRGRHEPTKKFCLDDVSFVLMTFRFVGEQTSNSATTPPNSHVYFQLKLMLIVKVLKIKNRPFIVCTGIPTSTRLIEIGFKDFVSIIITNVH